MPAAAVIPAPIGYIKVVAVKKLVVEFLVGFFVFGVIGGNSDYIEPPAILFIHTSMNGLLHLYLYHSVTESKLECSKQA